MHPRMFARIAVGGILLLLLGTLAAAMKSVAILALGVPPLLLLELFLRRLR
jgi:hypothetical protein